MTEPLTPAQRLALEAAERFGCAGSSSVTRANGSFIGMCRRLVDRGLLAKPYPYKITAAGRAALRWKDEKK